MGIAHTISFDPSPMRGYCTACLTNKCGRNGAVLIGRARNPIGLDCVKLIADAAEERIDVPITGQPLEGTDSTQPRGELELVAEEVEA